MLLKRIDIIYFNKTTFWTRTGENYVKFCKNKNRMWRRLTGIKNKQSFIE